MAALICPEFLNVVDAGPTASFSNTTRTFSSGNPEDPAKVVQDYMAQGLLDCDTAQGYINIFAGIYFTPTYWVQGSTFQKPTLGQWDITYNATTTLNSNDLPSTTFERGFRVNWIVTLDDGSTESRGSVTIGQCVMSHPECVSDFGGSFNLTTEQYFADNTTGTWPIVIGENNVKGVKTQVVNYDGPAFSQGVAVTMNSCATPFACYDGDEPLACETGGTTLTFSGYNGTSWPVGDICRYNGASKMYVAGISAPEDYYCCVTVDYNCCGGPAVFFGGSFLIPPPETPTPEQENISTPLLYTPIYLSNHTFQFINNYGRVPK